MGTIISLLLTAGMFCIIAGAVFGVHGKGLRRAGVGLLVLTFLPVVLLGILNEVLSSGQHGALGAVPTFLGALVIIITAYGITRLLQQRPEKPRRAAMKKLYTHRRENSDFLDFLRREIGGDE